MSLSNISPFIYILIICDKYVHALCVVFQIITAQSLTWLSEFLFIQTDQRFMNYFIIILQDGGHLAMCVVEPAVTVLIVSWC